MKIHAIFTHFSVKEFLNLATFVSGCCLASSEPKMPIRLEPCCQLDHPHELEIVKSKDSVKVEAGTVSEAIISEATTWILCMTRREEMSKEIYRG